MMLLSLVMIQVISIVEGAKAHRDIARGDWKLQYDSVKNKWTYKFRQHPLETFKYDVGSNPADIQNVLDELEIIANANLRDTGRKNCAPANMIDKLVDQWRKELNYIADKATKMLVSVGPTQPQRQQREPRRPRHTKPQRRQYNKKYYEKGSRMWLHKEESQKEKWKVKAQSDRNNDIIEVREIQSVDDNPKSKPQCADQDTSTADGPRPADVTNDSSENSNPPLARPGSIEIIASKYIIPKPTEPTKKKRPPMQTKTSTGTKKKSSGCFSCCACDMDEEEWERKRMIRLKRLADVYGIMPTRKGKPMF